MTATAYLELEKVLHEAIENKQSEVTISTQSIKQLHRLIRSYLRRDGILGFDDSGCVLVTPIGAAHEATQICAHELHEPSMTYETVYKPGTDTIEVHATQHRHTTIVKYSFAQLESKRKIKIIC